MQYDSLLSDVSPAVLAFIAIIVLWEFVWKGMALWRSAQRNQPGWFVVLLFLNTAGIIPIIYLMTHRPKTEES